MKITIKSEGFKDIVKQLNKRSKAAEKALAATTKDMKKRLPGKVADEVRTVYNIKKSEIMPSKDKKKRGAGGVWAKGETIDEVALVYRGRVLTPVHFSMTPKAPTRTKKGWRRVSVMIKKGRRRRLMGPIFLAKTGAKDKEKVQYIPFKRLGKDRDSEIKAFKTLSLPQMVGNKTVKARIARDMSEMLEKRLAHNVKRYLK